MQKKKKLSGLGAGIALAIALSFLLLVYAPMELDVTNQPEFWFSVGQLSVVSLEWFAIAAVAMIIGAAVLRLINEKLYTFVLAIGLSVLLALYVQGNFMASNLPPMDGSIIEWNEYPSQQLASRILWIALPVLFAAAAIVLRKKPALVQKIVLCGSGFLTLMLGVTLITLLLTTPIEEKDQKLCASQYNEFCYSEEENVIVMIMDCTSATFFNDELRSRPEVMENMDGFTSFENVAAGYPQTMMSVPLMLTGQWYENEGDVLKFQSNSIAKSPLFQYGKEEGYRMSFFDQSYTLYRDENEGLFENVIPDHSYFKSFVPTLHMLLELAGIKYFPWDLKGMCYDVNTTSQDNRDTENWYDEDTHRFTWHLDTFYSRITKGNRFTTAEGKALNYYHLEGAHAPLNVTRDVKRLSGERVDYTEKVGAVVTTIDAFISFLKENGVYDNSTIIICADHGYPYGEWRVQELRGNPFLLVKGINEHHEFAFSQAPISHNDFAAQFVELAKGASSTEAFPYAEDEQRDRRFIWYQYNEEDHMVEMNVEGHAADISTYVPTGNEYFFTGEGTERRHLMIKDWWN